MVRQSSLATTALVAAAALCLAPMDAFAFAFSPSIASSSPITTMPRAAATALKMAQKMTPTRRTRRDDSFDREANEDEKEEKPEDMITDFSEAQAKMKEEETARRVEEGLTTGLTKEDEDEFNANKGQYEDMRSKIRARASEEGFEKSVATKKAIEEATQRAMAGQASATPDQMLDLSGFGEKFMDDSTDELTAEEQAEIDKIASMPLLEQLQEELANTRFPTPMAIFQTACVMALIFAVSATLILKGDSTIRDFYMDLNFIPRPDEVYDFSDLDLPDGFLEQQDLEGNIGSAFKAATETADSILDN